MMVSDERSAALAQMPREVARLPRDPTRPSYPVPWFVAWIDGRPDFRVIDTPKIAVAMRERRCWVCGGRLSAYSAYVAGPMCCVNRTSAEPPSHRDCAVYSARACPFLARPHARRREAGKPQEAVAPAGIMLRRNPGVALVWITKEPVRPFRVDGGVLFKLPEPTEVLWFCEGREATRAEVEASIESGLPLLRGLAEEDGADAIAELDAMTERALELLPA